MPKFQLNGLKTDPRVQQLDEFTIAYIEAAFFTSEEELGDRDTLAVQQLADRTLARMVIDCAQFQRRAALQELDPQVYKRGTHGPNILAPAGHDFWMTRTGQGCGFWDGDWREPWADYLTTTANSFGSIDLYRGDDGRIYS